MWSGLGRLGLIVGLAALAGCAGSIPRSSVPAPPAREPAAFGTPQPERDETGAVTTVTAEQRGGQHLNLIEELFQGRIPGVQVIGESVRVRGVTQGLTASGGQEPLLILDGMPARGGVLQTLRGLNPDEVERIQVLRDVSSTAIYGTRGAGGVILVTLKND